LAAGDAFRDVASTKRLVSTHLAYVSKWSNCGFAALAGHRDHEYGTLVAFAIRERIRPMNRFLVAAITIASVVSLSACANDWIGKGKGKAPPPVAEPAPVAAEPVYK
jgi:hypothetical protein